MTRVRTPDTGADQRPITLAVWLATDLLRVLDQLRFDQHGRLPSAVRDDLDYHAGLLHLRIHRALRTHQRSHTMEQPTDDNHSHPAG